ncbi:MULTISPECIES: hypothetical protein [unclassified Polaribacter]|uniref:hypothetical protein n=1 Tax=unclassified Polaribacter TaxID=196858 RepID=UPI0011BE31BD|nr:MULTISPECIES: hypothetical protein [unclassified Polaribacter]TXD52705.1 hypothetical protein ES043_07660 [Polaribacter sp. IC063]TXD60673.1 hypothetical protein ES044_07190 [Polaribacter sp. IC066]
MSFFFKSLCCFFLLLFSRSVFSINNLPKLECYDKNAYQAGRQNWDIDIDKDGIVYFANSDGLLYNIFGEWKLKKMPKKELIRSVLVNNDTIYCGGTEIGYFAKKSGDLIFHKIEALKEDQVWEIISFENSIVFLAENQVIYYDKLKKTTIKHKFKPRFWSITKWRGEIWGVRKNGQIGSLEKGVFKKKAFLKELLAVEIRKIFVHNDQLFVVTLAGKLYSFDGKKIKQIVLPQVLKGKALFSGMSYDDSSFCLATISEGFIRINNKGEVLNLVNSKNGLLDNTVLSMAKDQLGNMWLGLDYGIAKIESPGPINQIFKGAATYDIINFKGKTYIATNKGLYCSSDNSDFQLIEGFGGQIWSLRVVDDELYVCGIRGLSKIVKNKVETRSIYQIGVYDLAHFEGTDYYLLLAYNGLILAKKVGEEFNFIKNLELWGYRKLSYDRANKCIWGEFGNENIYQLVLNSNFEVEVKKNTTFLKFFNTENGIFL